MASAITHVVAALGIGAAFYRPRVSARLWIAGAVCSVIPDLDVVGFHFGIRYGDFWGHRGFTHSLVFAAILTATVVLTCFPRGAPGLGRLPLSGYLFLATASHGVLDAMTNGGLGVAFFSPFNNTRYFFPWRPIRVSPISPARFFSGRGSLILQNEILWVWLPVLLFAGTVLLLRHAARRDRGELDGGQ